MPESASTFLQRYKNIPVTGADSAQTVSVTGYRSGDVWKSEWGKKVYNDLLNFLRKKYGYSGHSHTWNEGTFTASDHLARSFSIPEKVLHTCFNGKGSVDELARTLQVVDYYLKRADISLNRVGWNYKIGLQEFAGYYLGLDCNGFIGNYFKHEFPGSTIGASTHCNDFDSVALEGVKRQTLKDIKARDVLVREGGGGTRHVALIDYIIHWDKTAWVRVVQSASSRGGLDASFETLEWLKKPAGKGEDPKSVKSLKVQGYYDFNYAIGFPWAS